ncbi:phage integrase SAM-like domain-containing protein [Larkinella soli]|uniref:phage integrase SAM-like domain-containing protein n=1 Tax=Larkinella soli TaxID=1770527 RepID=UPI000FFB9B31|nr:phage integrase SAM-like domain-containing protein [Larkinella soli]
MNASSFQAGPFSGPALYTTLSHKPLRCRFEFRKNRRTLQASPAGIIQVLIFLGEEASAPLSTKIETTRPVWENRYRFPNRPDSIDLNTKIEGFRRRLELAHLLLIQEKIGPTPRNLYQLAVWMQKRHQRTGFDPQTEAFHPDAEVQHTFRKEATEMLKGIRRKVVTLESLYGEFIAVRGRLINDNRFTRDGEQISTATYQSYGYRWKLIETFLRENNLAERSLLEVTAADAVNLKEFLQGQSSRYGRPVKHSTIAYTVTFLRQLLDYAVLKGYLKYNPLHAVRNGGKSKASPKPLTFEQMDFLERMDLPHDLQHYLESWLVAAELCLHHADFMELPTMHFKTDAVSGRRYFIHPRVKQRRADIHMYVDVTPRAERLLAKWGGVKGLKYAGYSLYHARLMQISLLAGLRDNKGKPIKLTFGMGRDTGLTHRAMLKTPTLVLQANAGHTSSEMLTKYVDAGEQLLLSQMAQTNPYPLQTLSLR